MARSAVREFCARWKATFASALHHVYWSEMKETAWKNFRYRLEVAIVRLLAWFIPRLSRKGCVRLGSTLGALAFTLDQRGRAVSLANLEVAFGERYTPIERNRI